MSRTAKKPQVRLSSHERRELIIQKAGRLFALRGLHGVTTKEIAKACGVSEPVLYQHFKTKEDIYEALQSLCKGQTLAMKQLMNRLPRSTESLCVLTYFLLSIIVLFETPGVAKKHEDPEMLTRLAGFSLLEDGRFMKVLLQDCIGALFADWKECYEAAAKAKDLEDVQGEPFELWLAYQHMIGLSLFQLQSSRLLTGINDDEEFLDRTAVFLFRGMGLKSKAIAKNFKPDEWKRKAYFTNPTGTGLS